MGKVPAESVRGYAIGLNKGYVVTKRDARAKPSNRRKSSKRVTLIRSIIRSVTGLAAYEKRALELLKVGEAKVEKRASKFLKNRLGTWKRANAKKEFIQGIIKSRQAK